MERFQLFHRIHKGLRALLCDTSIILQRTSFAMEEEAREATNRLQFLVDLFDRFRQSMATMILPLIMEYEPGIVDSLAQDQKDGQQLGKKLAEMVCHFSTLSLLNEKVVAGDELMALFEENLLFLILHMTREEKLVNKVLWRYCTDAELQKLDWNIITASVPSLGAPSAQWLFSGLNNDEITRWLKELKEMAKEEDFQRLLKVVNSVRQPYQQNQLQGRVGSNVLVA